MANEHSPTRSLVWSTHCDVIVDQLRPPEEVCQSVKRCQFTAQQLLPFVIRNGVRASEVIHRGDHTKT